MALIELNPDWTRREFGVFCIVHDPREILSEAERREMEALRREKMDEWCLPRAPIAIERYPSKTGRAD